jgi:hypothetical protein
VLDSSQSSEISDSVNTSKTDAVVVLSLSDSHDVLQSSEVVDSSCLEDADSSQVSNSSVVLNTSKILESSKPSEVIGLSVPVPPDSSKVLLVADSFDVLESSQVSDSLETDGSDSS